MKVGFEDILGSEGLFVDGDWVETKDQDPQGEVRLIQLADIGDGAFIDKSNRFLTLEKSKELRCTILEKDDVIVARMPDPIGRACIFPGLDQPCVTVVDVCIIRPDKQTVFPSWLKYKINSHDFRNEINRRITGTTRLRISKGNLSKLKFELPPLQDQIRIATVLEKAEKLIRQRKESLQLLDKLLRDTFLSMFGDPVRNEKSIDRLGDYIADIKSGKSYGGFQSQKLDDDEFGVLKVSAVTSGTFDPNEYKAVKKSTIKEEIVNPKSGDLLFSRANTRDLVAATCIVPKDFPSLFLPDKIWRISLKEGELNKVFFHHLFQNESFRKTIIKLATGTSGSMLNVSMQKLRDVRFSRPSIILQNEFASIVEKVEALKEKYEASLTELENLYGSLSQRAFKEGGLDLSGVEVDNAEIEIEKEVKVKKGAFPFYQSGGGFPINTKIENQDNKEQALLSGDPSISKEGSPGQSKWELARLIGRGQNIPFNPVEGDEVLQKVFAKRSHGFTYQEFEEFLKKESFTFNYDDVKSYIFKKVEAGELKQFYASKEWMQTKHHIPISDWKHDFTGKGEIRLVVRNSSNETA